MPVKLEADKIGTLLTDVARLLRGAFDRKINASKLGLTPGEARTLIQAATAEGIKQADIAVKMGIEPMTLSVYLDRLEDLELVRRIPDAGDRRAKNVVVTAKADAPLCDLGNEMRGLMEGVTQGLDMPAREALRASLLVLRNNLRTQERNPDCGEKASAHG